MPTSTIPPIPGLHGDFLGKRLPGLFKHATADDLKRWRAVQRPAQQTSNGNAAWYLQVDETEQQTLLDVQKRSRASTHALAKALKDFKEPSAFAEPLLKAQLKADLDAELDVTTTELVEIHYEPALLGSMLQLKPRQQTLLQAAMQNFAADTRFEDGTALAPKGAFSLELKPGEPGAYPRFQYRYSSKLELEPERFAALCHALDLGEQYQEHVRAVYENPETLDTVRTLSINADKERLRQAAQEAFMKGEVSAAARTMINGLIDGQQAPDFNGNPVTVKSLTMFGTALEHVVVFSADRVASEQVEPVVVYLPGAALYPLKEYASVTAFKQDMRINLLQPAYLKLFRGYVRHHEHAHFFKRLNEALYRKDGELDPDANLHLRDATIDSNLFDYRQDQHLLLLKDNARDLLVPSAEVDEAAKKRRLAYWQSIGLNVLNAAAFFVPALGVVMAAVAAVQLVEEIVDGAHAWEAGDLDEALAHFESVALNVAMAVGLGAAGHLGASLQASEQVDGLVRVTLPGGAERLWKPDVAPYARHAELAGIKPDAAGVYRVDGTSYIRINDQVFEVSQDANATWSIRHPDDPLAYQPVLQHNAEGAWQAVGEQPLRWNHDQLLKRLGHATHGLCDEMIEQAVQISGVDDSALRRMHQDRLKMPPLLKDTLHRYQTNRRVSTLIQGFSEGVESVDGLEFGPSLSQELPRWPERVFEIYDETDLSGEVIRYGAKRWPSGKVIRISTKELRANALADKVLADLSEHEASDLFGSSVEVGKRREVLRKLIAERAIQRRAEIFQVMYEYGRSKPTAGQARLMRDFPLLTDAAALEIIDAADAAEQKQLQASGGRVPMRLAEEARVYQRQIVLNRAIQGLHEVTLANLDSDRLAVGLMAKLPGWTDTVRLELRESTLSGRLLASAGKPSGELKSVVHRGNAYRAYDAQGLELGEDEPLYGALLKALPDSERQALGLDIHGSQSLGSALYSRALGDRGQASTLLGQQPIKPWFRPPFRLADGRTGYPLGGAVGSFAVDARLHALFPALESEALEAMKARLLLENQHLGDAVFKLEAEYKSLEQTLEQWVGTAQDVFARASRQVLRRKLLDAWRRPGSGIRAKLALTGPDVGVLPDLTARFDHIHDLSLAGMRLEALPPGFLRCFPKLKRLSLEGNRLSEIPADVATLTGLYHLNLREVGLAGSDRLFDALKPLTSLQALDLQSCQLPGITDAALETLASLPALTRLNLRYNALSLSSGALQTLSRLPLQALDLSSTGLVLDEAAAQMFSRFTQLKRLQLAGNDLGRAPELSGLTLLEQLDLKNCRLSEWPAGLTTLMNQEPLLLESVDLSHNRITTLPVLAETGFGAALREDPDLSLNLYYNPLDAGSIANMSIVGAAFEPEIALPTEPDGDWLQGASQAQRELWQDFFENDGHGALRDMLDRLALSSEFRVNADDVRKRVWSMLELASQHTQLREELAAIAGDFPVTCGDAGADAFSALEIAVLVFQRSEAARVGERGADLLALYKQLFRRHEVQRMADVLSLARTRRRLALLNDEVLTPLDPLDDISNADLESESVDDIEIRLAMRQALAGALDYPEPSSGMLFERTAHLSKQTIKRVADAVKVRDTVTNRQGWMVGEGSWQRYLKQQYAGQFETLSASWAQGLDYLDYCNAVSDEVPAKLDAKVLKTLRGSLKAEPLNADGTLSKLDIDSAGYLAAVDALANARDVAEAALIDTLTKAQEAST